MQKITDAINAIEQAKDCFDAASCVRHAQETLGRVAAHLARHQKANDLAHTLIGLSYQLGRIRTGEGDFICAPILTDAKRLAQIIESKVNV